MLGTGDASSAYVLTRIRELWRTLRRLYTTSNRWSRVGKSTAVMSETWVNSAAVLSKIRQFNSRSGRDKYANNIHLRKLNTGITPDGEM